MKRVFKFVYIFFALLARESSSIKASFCYIQRNFMRSMTFPFYFYHCKQIKTEYLVISARYIYNSADMRVTISIFLFFSSLWICTRVFSFPEQISYREIIVKLLYWKLQCDAKFETIRGWNLFSLNIYRIFSYLRDDEFVYFWNKGD